jgi:histidine phosphotransferase ChpT
VIRIVLNVLMIANECLPKGGMVTLDAASGAITVTALGERAKVRAEIAAGLAGGFAEDGMASMSIMPVMTALLARQTGVSLNVGEVEGGFRFTLESPIFQA